MALIAEAVPQTRFDQLDTVQDWIKDTSGRLDRLSVNDVLDNGAAFIDDEYLGDGETMFRFNEDGIRSLCRLVGFRFDQLSKLESPLLATAVLNDLLSQKNVRTKLSDADFVVDGRSMTIIGIVSASYVSYDNSQFLADIQKFLESIKKNEAFDFQEGYVVNTELTVRFCSTKRHGEIKGLGGQGVDRTKLGMEFHNSMVGTSSVRVNYFLHRLVCANGMMVPASEAVSRIHHSGNHTTFHRRLQHRLDELVRKLNTMEEMLTTLGEIPFDPVRLVSNREVNSQLFEVIPAMKRTICDGERLRLDYPSDVTAEEKLKLKIEHDATVATLIPKYFAGEHSKRVFQTSLRDSATVFDLVNVFTEYAKGMTPSLRLDIEEKSGRLAKYISDNKKKL
jgi:hypothetical protein